jgi:hypothetical protein
MPSDTEMICETAALCLGSSESAPDGQQRCRDAAGCQKTGDAPVDVSLAGMHDGAAGLGDRRVEQVGADRRRRVDAEQQHQQRRHQRAAANPGEADDGADDKTRQGVHPVHGAPQPERSAHGSSAWFDRKRILG